MKMKRVLIFSLLILTAFLMVGCKKKGDAVISGETSTIVRIDSTFNAMDGMRAIDSVKGDVSKNIKVEGEVNTSKAGVYNLVYSVKGNSGKVATLNRKVEVKDVKINGLGETKVAVSSGTFNLESGVTVDDPLLGTLRAQTEDHKKYFDIDGDVDLGVIGSYQVTYTITIEEFTRTIVRTVLVVNEPILTVPNLEERIEIGSMATYNPLAGVKATRPVEVPILDENGEETGEFRITSEDIDVEEFIYIEGTVNPEKVGTYTLTYRIIDPEDIMGLEYLKDSAGDIIEVIKTVEIFINVEIRGIRPAVITQGDEDFDFMAGITGYDSVDGNVTNKITISGKPNVNRIGNYTVTYVLMGSDGSVVMENRDVTVQAPIEGRQDIVIMAGDVKEVDPFHPEYSGVKQRERQDAQTAAQEKHNVKVIYKMYPDNAAWGPDRINALIQASTAGEPLADIFYHVTTNWLVQLADGGAIEPVTDYIGEGKPGEVIDQKIIDAGFYGGDHYGFSTGALNLESGLYFNVDLLNELGIPNPAQLYLDGNWRWSNFKDWADSAQQQLKGKGEDYATLGGAISYFAENLVPLNGGQYLDMVEGKVRFDNEIALETYDFIHELYSLDLFEEKRDYDAGSGEWQGGKVLMHPGDLWFVKAANRWGNLEFELGFVPYPMADDYEGEYASPIYGSSIFYLSSGHTKDKSELAFNVWIDLQLWEGDFEPEEAYRNSLLDKFEDELYIDVYMTVYDKAYVEFVNSIGVDSYGANSIKAAINSGIPTNTYATNIAEIAATYQVYLTQYMRGKGD